MTAAEFAALNPRQRGYVVYMCGSRDDEPYVPNEQNPYERGTLEWADWDCGAMQAMLEVQDADDS